MLGDGIRRNLATVSKEERDLFIDAVKQRFITTTPDREPIFARALFPYCSSRMRLTKALTCIAVRHSFQSKSPGSPALRIGAQAHP